MFSYRNNTLVLLTKYKPLYRPKYFIETDGPRSNYILLTNNTSKSCNIYYTVKDIFLINLGNKYILNMLKGLMKFCSDGYYYNECLDMYINIDPSTNLLRRTGGLKLELAIAEILHRCTTVVAGWYIPEIPPFKEEIILFTSTYVKKSENDITYY